MDRSFVFAQGAFRNVHKGTYTVGRRAGQPCVCKIFKTGSVFEDSYFECDMKVVGKTLHLVEQWNNLRFVDKLIQVNKAEVWTFESNGERNLVEPFIYNWQKFNSNTGWTDDDLPWGKVMQALSHYSYHVSSGQFVLCDLQGGLNSNGAILTDPVIMSRAQGGYGPTDLGPDGIRNFFYRHRCNEYCRQGWTKPRNAAPIFAPRQGTSMMNSHQARHVPTMPFMQALTEHGDYYDSDSSS